ncbi:GlxA family transcriptional regulator [Emticicia sp. 21SJ11W-3]|uniref:GlxA family transcriptional regulator n=1 Tax=Emticicia sp. 21SJ11W-3 TaxID=2916755 RepID=UPI00209DD0D0|nr:helix-turn-helix domain-containing protein [Emticicia sp. 21SJ11W-3]UTA69357.1 helix-turn-helix domain-containing protein [Emticicia sp. 21SJ11W-3]
MKKISILVPESAVLASVNDPRLVFTTANQFLQAEGKPPAFQVQLVGLTREVKLHDHVFTVHIDATIEEVEHTDVVFVPALAGDMMQALNENQGLLPWIVKQYDSGAEVISLCVGAFLLASTGLLNGRRCSTHWVAANDFRNMFPDVELVDDKIITEDQGLYSSGGATSYWNLLLHLLEKFTDRHMAIKISKYFAIDIDRDSQASFMIFNGQKDHEDAAVKKAQEFIEKNFEEKITLDLLADMFAIGRRSLERRFKKATNNTVMEYIQRVKMEAAKKRFETSRKNISEVMYDVGYTDNKAFRSTFKKVTGLSPIAYKNKYNRSAVFP